MGVAQKTSATGKKLPAEEADAALSTGSPEPAPANGPHTVIRSETAPAVPESTAAAAASGITDARNRFPLKAPDGSVIPMAAGSRTPDERRQRVFDFLDAHGIRYTWYEHPEAPTCEIALRYCRGDGARHCKNLFFRNHKGDRHYLVCFDAERQLAIRELEQRLRQGKLSFASPERMERWLGLRPGSVSPFGLINDPANHVHLFLDIRMREWETFAFHPNDNRATVVLPRGEFLRYLAAAGNTYEYVELY